MTDANGQQIKFYDELRDREVALLLDNGTIILGRVQWHDVYAIGFSPNEDHPNLGLVRRSTSLLMKSFIRAVTPTRKSMGASNGRATEPGAR